MDACGTVSEITRLSALPEGERGVISRLELPPARAEALIRLGLIPGTELCCLRRSPFGDPTIYRFRGTSAALRRSDAERIIIKVYPDSRDLEERA